MDELSKDLKTYISSRNPFDSETTTEISEDSNSTSRFPNYDISPEKIKNLRSSEINDPLKGAPLMPKPTPFDHSDSLTISELGQNLKKSSLDHSYISSESSKLSDDYHSSVSHSVRFINLKEIFSNILLKELK